MNFRTVILEYQDFVILEFQDFMILVFHDSWISGLSDSWISWFVKFRTVISWISGFLNFRTYDSWILGLCDSWISGLSPIYISGTRFITWSMKGSTWLASMSVYAMRPLEIVNSQSQSWTMWNYQSWNVIGDWNLLQLKVSYIPKQHFSSPKSILLIDKLNNKQLSVCRSKILFLATKMHFLDIKQCVLN